MNRREHWQRVYSTKSEQEVSWFESSPTISLRLIEASGLNVDTCIVDIGGGESHLIDALVTRGLHCVAILDVSDAVLARAKARLAGLSGVPTWIAADVTGAWSLKPMDIWHDRAVFHFLTAPEDRAAYVSHLREVLKSDGTAIIATFAPDGPEKCSGLPVARYSPETLAAELGEGFELVESVSHTHQTPWGSPQSFQYSRLRRTSES